MENFEEQEIEIQDFFEMAKSGGIYEIYTPQGWVEIGNLYIKKNKNCYLIRTESGLELGGSDEHMIETLDGWKKLEEIDVNNTHILTSKGVDEIIAKETIGVNDTYDLEVKSNEHKYFSNDIVSHNCGKSMICKALIKELKEASVIYVLPSHFRNVEDIGKICSMAKDIAPTLLVIEDIDWLTQDRNLGGGGDSVVVELMNKMDGVEDFSGIVTVATTNMVDKVEEAIKNRPGRFDRVIKIPSPDANCRKKMLKIFTSSFVVSEDTDLDKVAKRCEGLNGAYIKLVCNTAAMIAIDSNSINENEIAIIKQEHFDIAIKETKDKDFTQLEAGKPTQMGFCPRIAEYC